MNRCYMGGGEVIDWLKLSRREQQIVALLAEGHRVKAIAHQLCRSPKTIEQHKSRIKGKLAITTSVGWMRFLRSVPLKDEKAEVTSLQRRVKLTGRSQFGGSRNS